MFFSIFELIKVSQPLSRRLTNRLIYSRETLNLICATKQMKDWDRRKNTCSIRCAVVGASRDTGSYRLRRSDPRLVVISFSNKLALWSSHRAESENSRAAKLRTVLELAFRADPASGLRGRISMADELTRTNFVISLGVGRSVGRSKMRQGGGWERERKLTGTARLWCNFAVFIWLT